MGREGESSSSRVWEWGPAPSHAPLYYYPVTSHDHRTRFNDNGKTTGNAVSLGFVATAILISMFLVMAIFEKLLRTPALQPASNNFDRGALNRIGGCHVGVNKPRAYSSPKISTDAAREVSVVMPGNNVPTFIANPVPHAMLAS